MAELDQSKRGSGWDYPLKTLPRPTGRATQVIITEYDLPRADIQPHDVIVDADGIVWYSNFGEQISAARPEDRQAHGIPGAAAPKKGWPTGTLDLESDQDGNMWMGMMYQGAIASSTRKTREVSDVVPAAGDAERRDPGQHGRPADTRTSTARSGRRTTASRGIHRVDLKTGKWETSSRSGRRRTAAAQHLRRHLRLARTTSGSSTIGGENIGKIDAKTDEGDAVSRRRPSARARAAAVMDDAGPPLVRRIRRRQASACSTPRPRNSRSGRMPTPCSAPYDVALDKNGDVWTGA